MTKVVKEDAWKKEYRLKHTFEFKVGETPKGLEDLDLDQEVTVVLTGKVSGVEKRKSIDGLDLCTFTVKRTSLEIQSKAKPRQMHEAVENSKSKRQI